MKTRHITYLTSNYPPETGAAAKRAGDASHFLQEQGWRVTVLTLAPNYPQGRVYEGYGQSWIDTREEDGVQVIRLRPWIVQKSNLILRLASEFYFALFAWYWTLRHATDVVYSSSPFMFLGPLGYFAAHLRHVPFIWEVRDLTWRYASATGRRTYGFDRMLERFMLWTGRRATALVTTTQGQLDYFVERNAAPERHAVIPNGVSASFLNKLKQQTARPNELDSKFRIVYAGLIGFPQGLATLVHAAKLFPEGSFYLVGDGAERPGLAHLAEQEGLANVHFPGYLTLDEVTAYYQSADVLVAQLRDDPVFSLTQPSKVWEYMAAGKPIVYGGAGEAASAVRASQAGLVVVPEDAQGFANALRQLCADAELRQSLGDNGKRYVQTHLKREAMLTRLVNLLENIHY